MRILGVDPGSRAAGWAVLDVSGTPVLVAAGVLRPPTAAPLQSRLVYLFEGLSTVIERERPDESAVERVFSGVNPQSLITLGEARGVLLLALSRASLPVHEITPAEVKRAVAGSGTAEKEQVRRMVQALLPTSRRLALDAADAAAIALTWALVFARAHARQVRPTPPGSSPLPPDWRRRPTG